MHVVSYGNTSIDNHRSSNLVIMCKTKTNLFCESYRMFSVEITMLVLMSKNLRSEVFRTDGPTEMETIYDDRVFRKLLAC